MRDYESGKWNPQRLHPLCSQNPGWRVRTLSTPCPLKDSGGEEGGWENKESAIRMASEWLQTSRQHWRQVGHFEEKGYPNWISLQQPDFTQGWKQNKDISVTQGPRGTALGCSGGSEVSTQTREPTRKEEDECLREETGRALPGEEQPQEGR